MKVDKNDIEIFNGSKAVISLFSICDIVITNNTLKFTNKGKAEDMKIDKKINLEDDEEL